MNEIIKTKNEITAIQETRWPGNGNINKNGLIFFYSGPENRTGQAGTGFICKKEIQRHIIDFTPYNERLCSLRLKGKYNKITIINTYAPTEEKDIEKKEQFYEDLQKMIDLTPRSDTVIILGDLNAQIGKENIYRSVSGLHTLHNETNNNGQMLCEFAITNNLKIMSTQFEHKRIHKGTWMAPDKITLNQIDHMLISKNKSELIEDVRTKRGPNIDSDHFLLNIIFRQSLPRIYKRKRTQEIDLVKWNKSNLQNPFKLREYRKHLHQKLMDNSKCQTNSNSQLINDSWANIRNKITEAANEVIQKQDRKTRNMWWDDECCQAIQEKNMARQKVLQHNTRANQGDYSEKRKIANKICNKKKKTWINDKIIEIESNYQKK